MFRISIYGIDPHSSHAVATSFIDTLFGKWYSATYGEIEAFSQSHAENNDVVFTVFAGPEDKHLKDILSGYLGGMFPGVNIIGYLFFLHMGLLDFKAEIGDVEISPNLSFHQLQGRYRDSAYIYTMCVKDFMVYFRQAPIDIPYMMVLGYYKTGKPDDDTLQAKYQDVREGLNLDASVPILACDINDKNDCKQVVLALMDVIGDFPNREKVMPLIEAL